MHANDTAPKMAYSIPRYNKIRSVIAATCPLLYCTVLHLPCQGTPSIFNHSISQSLSTLGASTHHLSPTKNAGLHGEQSSSPRHPTRADLKGAVELYRTRRCSLLSGDLGFEPFTDLPYAPVALLPKHALTNYYFDDNHSNARQSAEIIAIIPLSFPTYCKRYTGTSKSPASQGLGKLSKEKRSYLAHVPAPNGFTQAPSAPEVPPAPAFPSPRATCSAVPLQTGALSLGKNASF